MNRRSAKSKTISSVVWALVGILFLPVFCNADPRPVADVPVSAFGVAYDENGNLLDATDPEGRQRSVTYDALNRMKTESFHWPDPNHRAVPRDETQHQYTYVSLAKTQSGGNV